MADNQTNTAPQPAAPETAPADLDEYIFRHEGGWLISDR